MRWLLCDSSEPMTLRWREHVRRILVTSAFVWISECLSVIFAHRWIRACSNAGRRAFALLIGEPFEDEQESFSKKRLIVNDSYRDRLHAAEIAELADLSEALNMSIQQRKAFFRCFLHLDFMRRAGVSRSELLRYCNIRETPVARYLLRVDGAFAVNASLHQFQTQRWDVVQFLSLMFSLCTVETEKMIGICIQEIAQRVLASAPKSNQHNNLTTEINECLQFSFGVPNPVEKTLGNYLVSIYCSNEVDFVEVHGVRGLADVARYFPVLLFPCLWLQRVIRRRVLGEVTWRRLAVRRSELQLRGLESFVVSAPEIIAAAKVPVRKKERHPDRLDLLLESYPHSSTQATPRKVVPDRAVECENLTNRSGCAQPTCLVLAGIKNEDDAWRLTADSALATSFVLQFYRNDETHSKSKDLGLLFTDTLHQVQQRTITSPSVTSIQRCLIREYGYQFTAFLCSKSSIREVAGNLVGSKSMEKDEQRVRVRHSKADAGIALVEDKSAYWKEYMDPLLKRVFYHNIRTGESRWKPPSTRLIKRRQKAVKRQNAC